MCSSDLVKQIFGRIAVFVDFLLNYAAPKFVAEIDVTKIALAPTHYIGAKGDERVVDLVFQCPLKSGDGSLMAVIIFEHQSNDLKTIPEKLIRYISAIWQAELKEGKPLSTPYFIVLVCLTYVHTDRVWIDALITMFRVCRAKESMPIAQYQCDNHGSKRHIIEYNRDRLVGHRA